MNPVIVENNLQNQLITKSNTNSLWGFIRVVQQRELIDEVTGIVKIIKCSALVQGYLTDLKQLRWRANQKLPGNIVIEDSLKPFNPKNLKFGLKLAGPTNVICTFNKKPIYRRYKYVTNPKLADVIISIDDECKQLIRHAYQTISVESYVA
jgi:hypothetical protein